MSNSKEEKEDRRAVADEILRFMDYDMVYTGGNFVHGIGITWESAREALYWLAKKGKIKALIPYYRKNNQGPQVYYVKIWKGK